MKGKWAGGTYPLFDFTNSQQYKKCVKLTGLDPEGLLAHTLIMWKLNIMSNLLTCKYAWYFCKKKEKKDSSQ